MDTDPNKDPEFVRLFTISDSDEDSDDEDIYGLWEGILKPTECPYDRATRIQQANHELFSQPFSKKKISSKVQFDLMPQNVLNGDGANQEYGDAESVSTGESLYNTHTNSNPQTRSQRRDPERALVIPRRYSSLRQSIQNSNQEQQNPPQRSRQIKNVPPHMPQQKKSEENSYQDQQQTSGQNRQEEQQQSSEENHGQAQTPKERLQSSSKKQDTNSKQ